jgi:hypothetical protein
VKAYLGKRSNHVQNGLLLRADLHSLFDLGMLAIEPETKKVVLADALAETSYADLAGRSIAEPTSRVLRPAARRWSNISSGRGSPSSNAGQLS